MADPDTPSAKHILSADWVSFRHPHLVGPYLILLLAGTAALGLPGGAWILPAVATLPALVVLYRRYDAADLPGALEEMLLAALWMTGGMLVTFGMIYPPIPGADPGTGVAPVLNGQTYVNEMFVWLRTGVGAEGDPAQFVPLHLKHYAIVGISSLISAGVAAFYFGAIQLAYMNAYVYAVAGAASTPLQAFWVLVFSWHVWSIVRVISFITLATAAGYPLFALLKRRTIPWGLIGRMVAVSAALEVVDLALKAVLAEPMRGILRGLTGL